MITQPTMPKPARRLTQAEAHARIFREELVCFFGGVAARKTTVGGLV